MNLARFNTILACLLATLAVLPARRAAAADTTVTAAVPLGPSDFTFELEAYDPDRKDWILLNDVEAQYFFNRARCECRNDSTNHTGEVVIAIRPAQGTEAKIRNNLNINGINGGSAKLYVGGSTYNCLERGIQGVEDNCINLSDPSNFEAEIRGSIAALSAGKVWESDPIPVAWLFGSATNPMCGLPGAASCDSTAACGNAATKRIIYLWVETSGDGTPDSKDIKEEISVVGKVDLAPTNVTVKGGNEALTVRWEWPAGQTPSSQSSIFKGLQIFCVRGADLQVFEDDFFSASYMTAAKTCEGTVGVGSGGIADLDPKYLCSGLLSSTTNEHRITRLQNGAPYRVAVAVVDRYLNVSELSDLVYAEPIATVDFYTEYKDLGGAAQGGYCAMAADKRTPGLLAVAGLVAFGFMMWRRRRRGGAGPLVVVLLASAVASGSARAQFIYSDDPEDFQEVEQKAWPGTPRSYAIEARFALYTPDVDSEFSGDGTKPHSFVFGNSRRPMWQLEFDWELLQVFGTFAVGGVVGYFKENAKACEREGLDNAKGTCTLSGDNTSLRLIPFAALAIYRFDVLAERWKIPLVPYGKIGLNYTLWKVTEGNGYTPSAGGGRGAGGTMGWQAAVGISLQLDFLDPGAARGFDADLGVNHTYAFFELAHIDSSGLGSKGKLRVGDDTWFAGLMFEF